MPFSRVRPVDGIVLAPRGSSRFLPGADNGLLALEEMERASAASERFDLMILDMQMPGLDGYGTARRMRSEGIDLSVIALTAHAMDGDRQRCLAAGCDDYLTKPIDRGHLIAVCTTWTGRESEAVSPAATAKPAPRA